MPWVVVAMTSCPCCPCWAQRAFRTARNHQRFAAVQRDAKATLESAYRIGIVHSISALPRIPSICQHCGVRPLEEVTAPTESPDAQRYALRPRFETDGGPDQKHHDAGNHDRDHVEIGERPADRMRAGLDRLRHRSEQRCSLWVRSSTWLVKLPNGTL